MTVFGKVKQTDHRLAVQVGRNDERGCVDGVAVRGQGALSKILPVANYPAYFRYGVWKPKRPS